MRSDLARPRPGPSRIAVLIRATLSLVLCLGVTLGWGPEQPVARADEPQVVAAYGDSITNGYKLAKPATQAYLPRIAAGLGWQPAIVASNGAAAHCWGRWNTDRVVATGADVVIVALGTNDMVGSPTGCNPTQVQFRTAIETIITKIRLGLPDATIYVQAILWRKGYEDRRALWNGYLRQGATAAGAVYLDPAVPSARFPDGTHPDSRGHAIIANAWLALLP